MVASVPLMCHLITREVQCRLHQQVVFKPFAKDGVPHVVPSILHVYTQRLGFGLADDGGIFVSSAHGDEGANAGVDAAKEIGSMPCHAEGGNTSAARTCDGAVVRIGREVYSLSALGLHTLYARQYLLLQKTGKLLVRRVELLAAVVPHHFAFFVAYHARLYKHANRHGHLAASNQVVHHGGSIV